MAKQLTEYTADELLALIHRIANPDGAGNTSERLQAAVMLRTLADHLVTAEAARLDGV